MSVDYRIDPERGLVESAVSGEVTDEVMLQRQAVLRAHPLFRPHFRQLLDLSGVTRVQVTADCIRRLALGTPFGAGSRRAIVASRPAAVGMARMFQVLAEERQNDVRVFPDVRSAREWLGIAEDDGDDGDSSDPDPPPAG
ncbi:MAG: hypothetical protein JWM27_5035 [Gemmatimonadetes bacterium]|nr:hypothetical protein [Gemmatimonadota bacterium]